MQKIYKDCYELDRNAYDEYGLTEDILMEHAADEINRYIRNKFPYGSSVYIIAGPGNNGADGITLARLLHGDYNVKLHTPLGSKSQMSKIQLNRTLRCGVEIVKDVVDADIIVDAIFGVGLNRDIPEEIISLINKINNFDGFKIACDIPSGIDDGGRLYPISFDADVTITMGALKESLFLDESKDYIGGIIVANLGISRKIYEYFDNNTYLLDINDLKLPDRPKHHTHKGNFGHVSILCGEKPGAAKMSAKASTRFGAGLTTLVYHEKIEAPDYIMTSSTIPKNTTAIATGMGLGNHFEDSFIQKEIVKSDTPIILDADFMYREELKDIVKSKDREIVFTPHPKEFSAMWKILTDEDISVEFIQKNRFDAVRAFIDRFPNIVILLKGANMLIGASSKIYINPHGTSALSKGGSGDVLSGLIVALLAQGYSAKDATIQATLALTTAASKYDGNDFSMLPIDIIDNLAKI